MRIRELTNLRFPRRRQLAFVAAREQRLAAFCTVELLAPVLNPQLDSLFCAILWRVTMGSLVGPLVMSLFNPNSRAQDAEYIRLATSPSSRWSLIVRSPFASLGVTRQFVRCQGINVYRQFSPRKSPRVKAATANKARRVILESTKAAVNSVAMAQAGCHVVVIGIFFYDQLLKALSCR